MAELHKRECPHCHWISEEFEFKGSAMLAFYRHLDDSVKCAEAWEESL